MLKPSPGVMECMLGWAPLKFGPRTFIYMWYRGLFEAGTGAQSQAPLMAGTDSRKQLLTLIRDFAAEKSQGGENNFRSVIFGEKM